MQTVSVCLCVSATTPSWGRAADDGQRNQSHPSPTSGSAPWICRPEQRRPLLDTAGHYKAAAAQQPGLLRHLEGGQLLFFSSIVFFFFFFTRWHHVMTSPSDITWWCAKRLLTFYFHTFFSCFCFFIWVTKRWVHQPPLVEDLSVVGGHLSRLRPLLSFSFSYFSSADLMGGAKPACLT